MCTCKLTHSSQIEIDELKAAASQNHRAILDATSATDTLEETKLMLEQRIRLLESSGRPSDAITVCDSCKVYGDLLITGR